jgi:tRNA dimethylallyltransferase|tara:strand:- start:4611 stop:5561 length:951 start_codon:yes stop_codon:yes gene_type:complete
MNYKFEFPAIFLIGPTASGKTELSLSIAKEFPVEIISVDSAMVYKGLDIGTSKPSKNIRESFKHHLIDILSPEQDFDLGFFLEETAKALKNIRAKNKLPLFVGGSMLFHKTLLEGIHNFPSDINVRKEIAALNKSYGLEGMSKELKNIDPETYQIIDIKNARRVERALEIIRITGKKLSQLKTEPKEMFFDQNKCLLLGISDKKNKLEDLANIRLLKMVDEGFINELENLKKEYKLTSESQSMNSINYKQFLPHINGIISLDAAFNDAFDATKQLIKTQLNWMKKFELNYYANTEDINDSKVFSDTITTYLRSFDK